LGRNGPSEVKRKTELFIVKNQCRPLKYGQKRAFAIGKIRWGGSGRAKKIINNQ